MEQIKRLLDINRYLVYACDVQKTIYFEGLKRPQGLEIFFLESVEQLNSKLTSGYDVDDLDVHKERLAAGLCGCFAFVEKEYAHSTYICFHEDQRHLVDPLPYGIKFAHQEVCIGLVLTLPHFRRRGIYQNVYNEVFNFLKLKKATITARLTVRKTNIGSRVVLEKFPVRIESSVVRLAFFSRIWINIKSTKISNFVNSKG